MFRNTLRVRALAALTLLVLLIPPLAALAHQTVSAGNYNIEYGWLNEPPVAGQDNAIIINISGQAADHGHEEASATIALIDLTDGGTVQGDSFDVTVMIEGVDATAEGIHWHLYIDDKELAMAAIDQTTVTVNGLSNGAHTVKVALADADHVDFGEPAIAAITVAGATGSGEPSAEIPGAADEHAHDEAASFNLDVSALKLEIVYGGQTIPLALEPLKDGGSGQFTAPFTPDRAGLYTLKISGKLSGDFGETEVSAEVEPEEVAPGEAAPVAASTDAVLVATPTTTGSSNLPILLAVGGVVVVGLALGAFAFMRRK